MSAKHEITRADLIPMAQYTAERKDRKQAISAIKKRRRVEIGPFATFYFESYDTMWMQIHEMLYIEKGGDEQIDGELAAYNPLIPKGRELVATLMFEINDPDRRARVLGSMGGVERTISLTIGDARIAATYEQDAERSTDAGRASSVHFIRFPMSDAEAEAFKSGEERAVLEIGHPDYAHMAVIPDQVRAALAEDLD